MHVTGIEQLFGLANSFCFQPFIPCVNKWSTPADRFTLPHVFIRSNHSKVKLLRGLAEHLGCHWAGSRRALHQDSCNDFTTLLYSGSNHNRGGSHTAGNGWTVTRTG